MLRIVDHRPHSATTKPAAAEKAARLRITDHMIVWAGGSSAYKTGSPRLQWDSIESAMGRIVMNVLGSGESAFYVVDERTAERKG